MNILVLFTYKVSISDWKEAGIVDREFKLYKQICEDKKISYSFVTYGNDNDFIYQLDKFNVLPLYSKIKYRNSSLIQFFNSLRVLYIFKNEFKNCTIIKTNQLNGSWVGILAKLFYKKKLIIRTGYDLLYFSKLQNKSFFKLLFFKLLTGISLKIADYYIVSSSADRERLILKYGIKYDSKIKINSNWIEYPKKVKNLSIRNEKLIAVGRLEHQKNYSNLLKVINKSGLYIDIFGEGKERRKLENLINKYDIKANLKGKIENRKLQKLYQDYKYFVLNSHYEGNPKALLEAMSAGCVVIVRYHENLKEVIIDKDNGIFYNTDDELEKILMSLKDYDLNRISISARAYVKNNTTLDQHIDKELQLYKLLTDESS